MFNYFKSSVLLIVLLIAMGASGSVQAQGRYGNEWINHSQTYHKLKVTNTGLHRLSYGYLDSLGMADVNPKQLQLFRRGKEVSIHVAGEEDGRLDVLDFVEFYGVRNDGALDADLYKNPANQIHQFHSLYTDTAAYFLTYSEAPGKRMQVLNPAVNGKSPEPYHLQKALVVNSDRFNYGKVYDLVNRRTWMSWMDEGEGYASNFSISARNYEIAGVANIAPTGPKPTLRYATVGAFQEYHKFDVNVLHPNGSSRKLGYYEYDFFGSLIDKKPIEFGEVNSNGRVTIQIVPLASSTRGNAISFSFGELTYPQLPVFSGNQFLFYTDSTRASSPYYELTSAPATAVAYDVTDPYNVIRIAGHMAGNGRGFVIDGNTITRKILVANTLRPFKPVKREKNVKFRQINPASHNFIIITNKRLMRPAGGVDVPAPTQYAAYRASQAGGGFDTLMIHMDQVVDQFHYGEFSSNSIRRFMGFISSSAGQKHLFIIGKGLKYAADDYRSIYGNKYSYYHIGARKADVHSLDLVPTGIYPSSDIFFTADFRNNSFVPAVATGRLPATTPEEVISYLNKVKEYEAVPEGQPWQKNILQLGGGTTLGQINLIGSFLTSLKETAEGVFLGANVIEKYRQNVSQAVETINVSKEVNNGISLMTFFGHSSATTNDLDIGFVSNPVNGYANKGKYPIILMNGCNAGDAFIPGQKSFGEDWLLTPDKGAVGFLAHIDTGYDNYLYIYSANFYAAAFQDPDLYGETMGKVQQEVLKRVYRNSTFSLVVAMMTQMAIQGDPAIRLYNPTKPDYLIQQNGLKVQGVNNEVITAESPQFEIAVKVENLGKAIPDSITVSVKRTLADNTVIQQKPVKVKPIFRKDELVVPVKNVGVSALGLNTFEVKLDGLNEFEEISETNNTATVQHFFPVNGLFALSPTVFGIINTKDVTLVAQTTKLEAKREGYVFEVDTTHTFKSGLKKRFTAPNSLLPNLKVDLTTLGNFADSTVFFWRARFNKYDTGEDTLWATSSFRVINGTSKGWSQSHPGQLASATTQKLEVESSKPYYNFLPQKSEIIIKTVGGDVRFTIPPYGIFVNGEQQLKLGCTNAGASAAPRLYMVVVNDKNLVMVERLGTGVACGSFPNLYEFGDLNNATNRAKVEAFLNAIPTGYHVAVMSVNSVPFESFTESQKTAFKSIGSGQIDALKNGYPYAIVGRKGSVPGTAQERTALPEDLIAQTSQNLSLRVELASRQQAGEITSAVIGPAISWSSLHHTIRNFKGGRDEYKLSVVGTNLQGRQKVLIDKVSSRGLDISSINAKEYPYLQLKAFIADSTERTAPQLEEWMVLHTEAPEGIIRPDLVAVNEQLLTEQANKGSIKVPMVFQNISPTAFQDSVVVEFTLTGDGIQPIVSHKKLKPMAAASTENFEFNFSTLSLSGNYRLRINVNPRLQPEQHYFNNFFEVTFEVERKLHPIMDVAFDGVHILDGELVSPSPLISITVKDQNKHVFLQNPEGMTVKMINQEDGVEKEVLLKDNPQEVKYFPADAENDFRVEYKPTQLKNGRYTLEVNARDVSGKAAGTSPYSIGFEVQNESSITNLFPYPNPFSTKTHFVFTLTGATVPNDMKIQILTVTGKVVKEILKEEIGPVRVGNNKTEYAWDGTDTFGDRLANGVYLYRVVLSQDASEMKHKNNKGDKAFANGYGKLYILR